MTDLSIIIVSWNVSDLLAACLRSIDANRGDLALEVIVVDSASRDDTVAMVREQFPWVRLMPQSVNVGFTWGNNIGLGTAKGRHLLLLNPDTEIIGDMLTQLVAYLDDNPDVGVVGPHTLNTDGSTQSSRRRFPTVATGLLESTWLQPIAPKALLDWYYVREPADDATVDVDWVQGHALMARRAVYEQIGGLDTSYVMFFEEVDWCKRAKSAGWRVVYVGSAQVTHHGGQSTAQVSVKKDIHFNRSKVQYFRKYHGGVIAEFVRVSLLLMFVWQLAVESTKWALRHKPELRRERMGVYWQVLKSGLR